MRFRSYKPHCSVLTNHLDIKYFRPHYNLNLQSISVNGQILQIDPSVFATSSNRGTIVDSGTTLAYLASEAYDPFISAVSLSYDLCDFLVIISLFRP